MGRVYKLFEELSVTLERLESTARLQGKRQRELLETVEGTNRKVEALENQMQELSFLRTGDDPADHGP